jgi:SAM-dependent methyltransferase
MPRGYFVSTLAPTKILKIDPGPGVLAPTTPDAAAWTRFYDEVYRSAQGDPACIPWEDGRANPSLVAWLNSEAPMELRPGARVTVVGCGLGHDVVELAARGYDVTGFDVSPAAVEWARRLHPACSDRFSVANLFDLPREMLRRSDLVAEVCTLQSMHPTLRASAAAALTSLMRPHGCLLVVCRGRRDSEPLDLVKGPPFPLTSSELCGLMEAQGLHQTRPVEESTDSEPPSRLRLRAAFRRR